MSMKPIASSSGASVDAVMAEIMEVMPENEIFVKDSSGKIVGTGMQVTSEGTLLAPDKFGVESGSVEMGDLLTLSEASGYLAIMNRADGNQYYMVDYNVPKTGPSGSPRYFKLTEAENIFEGQNDGTKVINLNPLVFTYTTKLNARTNSLFFTAASAMKNVKIRIYRQDMGVTLKYLPSKAAWQNNSLSGYDFTPGENKIDFLDSPLPLDSGTMLTFEIKADSMALRGSSSNVPLLKAMVQRGELVDLASADQVSPDKIRDALISLQSPNKLPKTAIQDGVFSVNGAYGDVVLTAETLGVQPRSENLEKISSVNLLPSSILYSDDTAGLRTTALSSFVRSALSLENEVDFRNYFGFGTSSILDTNVPNGILQLDEEGKIPSSMLELTLAEVAYSGEYDDLTGRPDLFSGDYEDLQNKPNIFSGNYSDLVGSPNLFSGSYRDLSDKPTIPELQISSDWNAVSGVQMILNKPSLFSGSYTDLTNKPVLFDGTWGSLSGKPSLSTVATSGNYNDLLNKPTIPVVSYPVTSVNSKTGAVVLTSADIGAAAAIHNHVVGDVVGLQASLDSKISAGSQIPYSTLTGAPAIPVNNSFSFKGLNDTDDTAVANGFLRWNSAGTSISYSTTIPYAALSGAPALSGVAISGSYSDLINRPTIPTSTSQLTNDSGYITSSPVVSVNGKTGAVVLSASEIGAASAAQGTRYIRSTNIQASGVKVKYYSATSDSAGAWTLPLGTDFTEILDVQVQAVSSSGIAGVRQATINSYTPTSTSLSGSTYGNNVLTTVLIGLGANTLSLLPSTVVRIRVEGLGT